MTAFTDVSSSLAELTLSYMGQALTYDATKKRSNGASLSLTEIIKRVHLIVSHQTTLQVDVKLLCQPTIGHIPEKNDVKISIKAEAGSYFGRIWRCHSRWGLEAVCVDMKISIKVEIDSSVRKT